MQSRRVFNTTLMAALVSPCTLAAKRPTSLSAARWDEIHRLIRPQPGESRWMEIDWYPSVWEARQEAAAEGKPILLMAGSGGAPAAGC
jgi:hypothetical protein